MVRCSVSECDGRGKLHANGKRYFPKGYCARHYQYLQRYNNVNYTFTYKGNPGKRSLETREKLRINALGNKYHYGKKHSEESKKKISDALVGRLTGENNPNWKGGVTTESYRQRREFKKKLQKKVFERDDYTCTMCYARGGCLQVDHIKKWSEYPELRFDMDNCRTLCMACHYYITFNKKMPKGIKWGHTVSHQGGF